jgi:nitrile hydratase accessory protein
MQPDTPNFEEPWQAEALALAMALMGGGRLSNAEWSAGLGAAIKRATEAGGPDDGSTYYEHVLDVLEQIVLVKSMVTADESVAGSLQRHTTRTACSAPLPWHDP